MSLFCLHIEVVENIQLSDAFLKTHSLHILCVYIYIYQVIYNHLQPFFNLLMEMLELFLLQID